MRGKRHKEEQITSHSPEKQGTVILSDSRLLERRGQGEQKTMLLIFSEEGHKAKYPR